MPFYETDDGVPVGVQLVGPPGRDDLVLSLAAPLSLGFDETAAVLTLVLMHVLTAAIVIVTFTR